ncbi:tannase-domain-containing protein [Microstroma glucosiphilum]|uniref:Carboxylic ester hydrolase n=1 Tax=Pseudomicrostroma glucosiphilum TaxID=1684307 RepID=A0A316TZ26_9BASI|nr:tannase-domain-containing protein [Pseudomicrostroma glucosiphilum]PWN18452.1 tannase-domain-containing protein [Pseudomicrostroma glucosiphilum]
MVQYSPFLALIGLLGLLLPLIVEAAVHVPTAGPVAEQRCEAFASTFSSKNLVLNLTFSQYWEQGSNPSLELLASSIPLPIYPEGPALQQILAGVGPDVDISRDGGYGWNSRKRLSEHGPLGGLPAFCRFGALIVTSNLTQVYMEAWMPFKYNPSLPLAPINASDFPTNSTPISLAANGDYLKAPSSYFINASSPLKNVTAPDTNSTRSLMTAALTKSASASTKKVIGDPHTPSARTKFRTMRTTATATGNDTSATTPSEIEPEDTPASLSTGTAANPTASEEEVDEEDASIGLLEGQSTNENGNKSTITRRWKGHSDSPLTGREVLGSPKQGWNGRLLLVANGGFRGAIPWPTMKQSMSRLGMAVVGNNQGHFGGTGVTTWINGTQHDETLVDWGTRGVHVSKVLADEVLDAFYGVNKGKKRRSYFAGCSNGGKSALASAQSDPGDFDGILAGSPGVNFNRMNVGQILFQTRHRKGTAKGGWFSNELLAPMHQVILDQCDTLDGVKDGVLTDPRKCNPDFDKELLCKAEGGKGNYSESDLCLSSTQLTNLKGLYQPATINGSFVYPAFPYSWESDGASFQGTSPKARFWLLANRREPNYDNATFDPYTEITYDQVVQGDIDGTAWTADVVDLSPAINSGTKIISYHGLSDMTISPYSTQAYYSAVANATEGKIKGSLSDHYRFFDIPGMGHCRNGPGAWHFGGITQEDGGNRPLVFDTRHDMLLSLVAWVEKGHNLPYHVGASYKSRSKVLPVWDGSQPLKGDITLPTTFEDKAYGVEFTRKLCPWPQQAVYDKQGTTKGKDAYMSFTCQTPK